MEVSFVQLQRLVGRTSVVVEALAAAWLRRCVSRAMEDEHRQRHERKLLFEPLVGPNHLRQRLRRLRLVGDERIVVHGLHGFGIAREDFVLQVQDVGVRGHMAEAFEDREGKIWRRHFVGKALADQPRELRWMLERVDAGDDAACAVAEQKQGQSRFARFRQRHERGGVADIVRKFLDVEALAI